MQFAQEQERTETILCNESNFRRIGISSGQEYAAVRGHWSEGFRHVVEGRPLQFRPIGSKEGTGPHDVGSSST